MRSVINSAARFRLLMVKVKFILLTVGFLVVPFSAIPMCHLPGNLISRELHHYWNRPSHITPTAKFPSVIILLIHWTSGQGYFLVIILPEASTHQMNIRWRSFGISPISGYNRYRVIQLYAHPGNLEPYILSQDHVSQNLFWWLHVCICGSNPSTLAPAMRNPSATLVTLLNQFVLPSRS